MKFKGRIYTPTGRQFEMMEVIVEEASTEKDLYDKLMFWSDKLHHCKASATGITDQCVLNGTNWRKKDNKWEFFNSETQEWEGNKK